MARLRFHSKLLTSNNSIIKQGFGVSLAWWAKAFGNREDLADALFTLEPQVYITINESNTEIVPGLGLNIARYNAGACSNRTYLFQKIDYSPNIQDSRKMEGYWVDGYSSNPNSESFDWNEDSFQREMAKKAWKRGVRYVELFSNSPMWWQLKNNNPSGNLIGAYNNLESKYAADHARYLATIAKWSQNSDWGFNFTSIELFNEPSSVTWSALGAQEGCHFGTTFQSELLNFLKEVMESLQLDTNLLIPTSSDENNYDQALTTWFELNNNAKNFIKKYNTHGYQYQGGPVSPFITKW
eukprot:TRINITY_DN5468_c0_g1_i1.p1 TRINITY_DN5468_c0_g1~~TRINITY_DN5468_c0_g1_i1.p1  ORF type:complete len:297 (+),score=57.48 TRINITY_DN5468_c0_g1_i1:134-1024(+)